MQLGCNLQKRMVFLDITLAEILHHLGCMKPYKLWENYLSTGAGFQPSTVHLDIMVFRWYILGGSSHGTFVSLAFAPSCD